MFTKIARLLLRKSESCCFHPGSADVAAQLRSRIISGESTACTSSVPGRRFRPGVWRRLQWWQNNGCSALCEFSRFQCHCGLTACCAHRKKRRARLFLGKTRWCSPPSESVHHHFSLIQRWSWEPYEGWRGCLGNLNDAVWGLFMLEFCRVMKRYKDRRHLQHICSRRRKGNSTNLFSLYNIIL